MADGLSFAARSLRLSERCLRHFLMHSTCEPPKALLTKGLPNYLSTIYIQGYASYVLRCPASQIDYR